MGRTSIGTRVIRDDSISRSDLNTLEAGESVITKVLAGSDVSIAWTGADPGTGDVTISVDGSGDNEQLALTLQKFETLYWMGI